MPAGLVIIILIWLALAVIGMALYFVFWLAVAGAVILAIVMAIRALFTS